MSALHRIRISTVSLLCIACLGCNQDTQNPDNTTGTPDRLPSTLKVKHHSKTYVITGLGLSNDKRIAIINNLIVSEGSEIGPNAVVKEINLTYAGITIDGRDYLIRPESLQRELESKKP